MFERTIRDRLLTHLVSRGIEAKIHYPVPLHLQPASPSPGLQGRRLSGGRAQATRIITLPVHQHLTDDQVSYMVESVRRFYRG